MPGPAGTTITARIAACIALSAAIVAACYAVRPVQAGPPEGPDQGTADAPGGEKKTFPIPDWVAEARWYFLEVGRFYNGERSNDPPNTVPWTAELNRPSSGTGDVSAGGMSPDLAHYGGDLQGLRSRLSYFEELAANAVVLDPIFHGTGSVPRAVTDPRHIDDTFGIAGSIDELTGEGAEPDTWRFTKTDRLLLRFVKDAHEKGIRIVLSGLFGDLAHAVGATPPSEKKLLAVTKRWMDPDGDGDPSDGVDGWFVHLPANVPHDFWPKWRTQVKETNRDALLIVSDPTGGSIKSLHGSFDVELNATCGLRVQQFFRKGDAGPSLAELVEKLEERQDKLPDAQRLGHINMLSDLKGPRLVTLLGVPGSTLAASAFPQSKVPSTETIDRWRLATILQHFYPGAPLTYYGDEVGMYGLCRPWPRPPMWWLDPPAGGERPDGYRGDLFGLVRWLHHMRERYEPLRRGIFDPILVDEEKKVLAVSRARPGEAVILVMNYGTKKQKVMLPAGEPGQMVGLLSPNITPAPRKKPEPRVESQAGAESGSGAQDDKSAAQKPEGNGSAAQRSDYSHIRRIRMGGSRQYVNENGNVVVWVSPMSIRVVLVDEDEPWRR